MKIISTVSSRGCIAFVPPPPQVPKSASSRERGGAGGEQCLLMTGQSRQFSFLFCQASWGGICSTDPSTMQRAWEILTGMCRKTPDMTAGAEKGRGSLMTVAVRSNSFTC